jgi:dihydrofolate reductase
MAELIYGTIMSLDGFIEDASGNFDWAAPDEEVHHFVNELEKSAGTYLYGRGTYETMRYWQNASGDDLSAAEADYAHLWRQANKIVYSRTLEAVDTERTQLRREFEAADIVQMKQHAESNLSIAGATLAAHALRSGLVDDVWVLVNPVVVGSGKRAFPDDLMARFELVDQRRFGNGVVYMRYSVEH